MGNKPKAYWELLKSLRQNFLTEAPVVRDYWSNEDLIQAYDESFGQRIGWKWQSVLQELDVLGWAPPPGTHLIDWGCGTGVASRACLASWDNAIETVYLHDRSPKALTFAANQLGAQTMWQGNVVTDLPSTYPDAAGLVLSHVLTELPDKGVAQLRKVAAQCRFLLAVEPGTREAATKLSQFRDQLLAEGWKATAPCTHSEPCPALVSHKHWCHSFATPPQRVFHSAFWRQFSEELNIDLRGLPYAYILMEKTPGAASGSTHQARIIGRPRTRKTHAQALLCSREGLEDKSVISRKNPADFTKLTSGVPWL